MGLKPFQKGRISQAQPKAGKLKPFVPRAKAQVQPQIQNNQSKLQELIAKQQPEVDRLKKEAEYANSKKGFLMNTLKAVPQALADVTLGNIARLGVSAVQTPFDVAKGEFSDKQFKIPGLSPFKTFQRQIGETQEKVISGEKGLGSLAWDVAQVPLAGLDAWGTSQGLSKTAGALKAFKKTPSLRGAGEVVGQLADSFLPTTKNINTRGASRSMAAQMGRKSGVLADSSNLKTNPLKKELLQPKTNQVPQSAKSSRQGLNEFSEKSSSYLPNTTTKGKILQESPLIQEARKSLYHGTTEGDIVGNLKAGNSGVMWMAENPDIAKSYANTNRGRVLEFGGKDKLKILDITKREPLRDEALDNLQFRNIEKYIQEARKGGYDAIRLRDRGQGVSHNSIAVLPEGLDKIKNTSQISGYPLNGRISLADTNKKGVNQLNDSTYTNKVKSKSWNQSRIESQPKNQPTENANKQINNLKNNSSISKSIAKNKQSVKSQPLQEGVESLAKKADQIVNPPKVVGRERGHVTSIAKSNEVSTELGRRLRENPESTIKTRHQEPLVKEAQKMIFDNVNEAERIAKTEVSDRSTILADELAKHYDSIATQAKAMGDEATFNRAMDKAIDITINSSKDLSETARALSAARRINMLSPEGIIQYVNKAVKQVGAKGLTISNDKYFEIVQQAKAVQQILDPKQKALATFDLIDNIYTGIPKSTANKVSEALNLPRSIMATADLSAPFRQGIFTAAKHPIMFAKNFGSMLKYAFSENAYRNLKADILTSPNYSLYVKHKLPITDVSVELTGREEQFLSSWAEKIPGFGKLAKGSNRAYSGFLNKMRMDLFDDLVNTAKLEGIKDAKFFDDAANYVGAATGRGRLFESLEPHASLLNGVFFSPRLMASRINLINPVYYAKLHPTVRKEALKTLVTFVGSGMSVLGLAKLNGAEVGADPRSADFGKIKIGNTRYDIWGGFQQYARLIAQLTTGEKISTTTGRETTLGAGGYNAPTRESIFMDFLKSKANPLTSFAIRASQGELYGEKFNLPAEVLDRFIPMIAQDAFDLTREYGIGKGLAMAVPGALGIGSMTYGSDIPMFSETKTGNIGLKYRGEPGIGETIINKITGKKLSNVPEEYWKPLAEERLVEQKRQAEVDKAKAIVLTSGEPQQVGDTYIYLENGIVKTKKQGKAERLPIKERLLYEKLQERTKNSNPYYK